MPEQKEIDMKQTILAIAVAAAVLSSIGSAYAQQQIDCTVVTRQNMAQCAIQHSQSGKEG